MGAHCSHECTISDAIGPLDNSFMAWFESNKDERILRLMMPVYFSPVPASAADLDMVKECWELITSNKCPLFTENKESGSADFRYKNSAEWFSVVFYKRLFNVHPLSRPMFSKDSIAQGRFFVALFSFVFSVFNDPQRFKKRMQALAVGHNKKGIKAIEYGIIGEVMFYSLKIVLGPDVYTPNVHRSWVRVFSAMLDVIVPRAVFCELMDDSHQRQRAAEMLTAHSYSFRRVVGNNGSSSKSRKDVDKDKGTFLWRRKGKKKRRQSGGGGGGDGGGGGQSTKNRGWSMFNLSVIADDYEEDNGEEDGDEEEKEGVDIGDAMAWDECISVSTKSKKHGSGSGVGTTDRSVDMVQPFEPLADGQSTKHGVRI